MKFEVGDKVVYPNQGVAVIQDRVIKRIGGIKGEYFLLAIETTSSTVMVPADNIDSIGLRRLSSKGLLKKFYRILKDGSPETETDAKERYKQNVERMKTGSLVAVGEVLKSLHVLSQKKNLGIRDQRMFDSARQLVVSELAAVEGISEEEAWAQIETLLEPPE